MDVIENIRWVPNAKQRAAIRLASLAAGSGGQFSVSLCNTTGEFEIGRDGIYARFKTEAACRRAISDLCDNP